MSHAENHNDAPLEKPRSLASKAKSGAMWLVVGFGVGQISRLVLNMFLAATLYQEAFALMAIIQVVLVGLGMFSDIGLKANVVQSARGDDPAFYETAWTLQVIRGVALFIVALILAWPVSQIYGANDPKAYELLYLIPIAATTALICGFHSVKIMMAERHMRIGDVVRIDWVANAFNIVITCLLAWYMRSVYALPIAAIAYNLIFTVLSYFMLKGPRSKFRWDSTAVAAIVSFGKWIFLSSMITFLAIQIDRMTFAAIFPLAEVGVYSIASSLALMIPTLMGALQHSVAFPMYSRLREKGVELNEAYGFARMPLLVGVTLCSTLLVVGADAFFELAYDDRYAEGGEFLPILACSVWFGSVTSMYGSIFLANEKTKWIAFVGAFRVAAFVVLLFLFVEMHSSFFVSIFAVLISDLLAFALSQYLGRRVGIVSVRIEFVMFLLFLFASGLGWWVVHHLEFVASQSAIVRLLIVGVIELVLFGPLIWISARRVMARR